MPSKRLLLQGVTFYYIQFLNLDLGNQKKMDQHTALAANPAFAIDGSAKNIPTFQPF
jgi:hypothetical protein